MGFSMLEDVRTLEICGVKSPTRYIMGTTKDYCKQIKALLTHIKELLLLGGIDLRDVCGLYLGSTQRMIEAFFSNPKSLNAEPNPTVDEQNPA